MPAPQPVRLAELIGALSLATDHAAGMAPETALRTAVVAVELSKHLGHETAVRSHIFYTALLRFIGCTAYAPEAAQVAGGDDLSLMTVLTPPGSERPAQVIGYALRHLNEGRGALARAGAMGRLLGRPTMADDISRTHCEGAAARHQPHERPRHARAVAICLARLLCECIQRNDGKQQAEEWAIEGDRVRYRGSKRG